MLGNVDVSDSTSSSSKPSASTSVRDKVQYRLSLLKAVDLDGFAWSEDLCHISKRPPTYAWTVRAQPSNEQLYILVWHICNLAKVDGYRQERPA